MASDIALIHSQLKQDNISSVVQPHKTSVYLEPGGSAGPAARRGADSRDQRVRLGPEPSNCRVTGREVAWSVFTFHYQALGLTVCGPRNS